MNQDEFKAEVKKDAAVAVAWYQSHKMLSIITAAFVAGVVVGGLLF
jgi:hypothetical protein